jgi:hypothetical protein
LIGAGEVIMSGRTVPECRNPNTAGTVPVVAQIAVPAVSIAGLLLICRDGDR